MIVVYKITNLINQKIYIGVHRCKILNDNYYGSGKLIKLAILKYGKENFKREYLHIFNDDETNLAFEKEREYVTEEFTLQSNTYNISEGGHINPVMYGENNPFYGKSHLDETKQQIVKSREWYSHNEEVKLLISESNKNRWSDIEYREKVEESFLNRNNDSFHTDTFKEKISKIHKGKIISDKQKQLLREHRIGKSWGNHTEETKKIISEKNKGKDVSDYINEVNKNPEKIRKTAEKHRGMKRSEEAKNNMKEAQKNRFKNESAANKGMKWINNPITKERKYINENEVLPEGFVYGIGSRK